MAPNKGDAIESKLLRRKSSSSAAPYLTDTYLDSEQPAEEESSSSRKQYNYPKTNPLRAQAMELTECRDQLNEVKSLDELDDACREIFEFNRPQPGMDPYAGMGAGKQTYIANAKMLRRWTSQRVPFSEQRRKAEAKAAKEQAK